MHYKDGTPANLGDVVKGKGYNVKGPDGQLKEIIGTVVGLTAGTASCNIQVAHVVTKEKPAVIPDYRLFEKKCVIGGERGVAAFLDLEYGQCDHFEKIG